MSASGTALPLASLAQVPSCHDSISDSIRARLERVRGLGLGSRVHKYSLTQCRTHPEKTDMPSGRKSPHTFDEPPQP